MVTIHEFIDDCIDLVEIDYNDRIANVIGLQLKHDFERQRLEKEKQKYITRLLLVKDTYLSTDLFEDDDTYYTDIYF